MKTIIGLTLACLFSMPLQTQAQTNLPPELAPLLNSGGLVVPNPERVATENAIGRQFASVMRAGDQLLKHGNIDGAISQYRLALEIRAVDTPYIRIGDALRLQGKINEAVDAYRSAVAMPVSGSESHEKLGDVYASQGRDAEAIEEYQVSLSSTDARKNFKLALLYNKHQQFAMASQMYWDGIHRMDEKQQSLFPQSFLPTDFASGLFAAINYVALAVNQADSTSIDDVITEQREAISLQPNLAVAHYFLGEALTTKGGKTKEARAEYQKARQLGVGQIKDMAEHRLGTITK